jgi:hypothetical protein
VTANDEAFLVKAAQLLSLGGLSCAYIAEGLLVVTAFVSFPGRKKKVAKSLNEKETALTLQMGCASSTEVCCC